MSALTIRECAEVDIDALEGRMPTGGHRAHAAHFARQRAGTGTYLTAWDGDVPVGSGLVLWDGPVAPEIRAALPDAVEICMLRVHPDARGRGVGTALIRAAEELIRVRGRRLITVGVADDNRRAAALYARLGYRDSDLRSTSRYSYPDADGVPREVVERDFALVKRLD